VDKLDAQLHLFDLLTANVAAIARAAREHAAAQQPAETRGGGGAGSGRSAVPPGEGVWSHSDLVAVYLSSLQRLYDASGAYMSSGHAGTLWSELVQGAPARQDMVRAVAFFKAAVGAREPWLENADAAALLRRVTALPPGSVTKEVFHLTWSMFLQVGERACGGGQGQEWGQA
jgi:hypothetical protein